MAILGNRYDNLCKTIVQEYVECKRKRGRPKRGWTDDLIDYTQLYLDNYWKNHGDETNEKI